MGEAPRLALTKLWELEEVPWASRMGKQRVICPAGVQKADNPEKARLCSGGPESDFRVEGTHRRWSHPSTRLVEDWAVFQWLMSMVANNDRGRLASTMQEVEVSLDYLSQIYK